MMTRRETLQQTLDGSFSPALPFVRTTDGHIIEWDRNRIAEQIKKETKLVETFYGYEAADDATAQEIARQVEQRILSLGLKSLSGPLIREIMNITLLEKGMLQYRNVCTRVGTPVYDAHQIDVGKGFEAHDNANLQENAETSHKKKADKISKEQYLLQPSRILPITTSPARCTSTTSNISGRARSARTGTCGTSSTTDSCRTGTGQRHRSPAR